VVVSLTALCSAGGIFVDSYYYGGNSTCDPQLIINRGYNSGGWANANANAKKKKITMQTQLPQQEQQQEQQHNNNTTTKELRQQTVTLSQAAIFLA
jgi:hypothetical protein